MPKTDNSSIETKTKLRRRVLRALAVEQNALRVLELYAGSGRIRQACYRDVGEWQGVDIDPLSVATVCGDAGLAIRSGVLGDLGRFDVIDIDPYANPWHALWLVSERRRSTRPFAVFLTEGGTGGCAAMTKTIGGMGWGWPLLVALGLRPEDRPSEVITRKRNRPRLVSTVLAAWFGERSVGKIFIGQGGGQGGTFYAGAIIDQSASPEPAIP